MVLEVCFAKQQQQEKFQHLIGGTPQIALLTQKTVVESTFARIASRIHTPILGARSATCVSLATSTMTPCPTPKNVLNARFPNSPPRESLANSVLRPAVTFRTLLARLPATTAGWGNSQTCRPTSAWIVSPRSTPPEGAVLAQIVRAGRSRPPPPSPPAPSAMPGKFPTRVAQTV